MTRKLLDVYHLSDLGNGWLEQWLFFFVVLIIVSWVMGTIREHWKW